MSVANDKPQMPLSTKVGLGVLFILIVALVVVALVAGFMKKPPYPATPTEAPKAVAWQTQSTESAWPVESYYRYAYVDIVHNLTGPWSPVSTAVRSSRASGPLLEIIPTGTTTTVWQRKVPALSGTWEPVPMLPLQQQAAKVKQGLLVTDNSTSMVNELVATTNQARVHSSLYLDPNNPGSVPERPPKAPKPLSSGAAFVEHGLSWNKKLTGPAESRQKRLIKRFACRFVSAEPGPWSAWSEARWASDKFTSPVLDLPHPARPACVQYSASWMQVTPDRNNVSLKVSLADGLHSFVQADVSVGLSTLDSVLQEIRELCEAQAKVQIVFDICLETSLVSFGLTDLRDSLAQSNFTLFLTSHSVFRLLGFNMDSLAGQYGRKYTASSVPDILYRPVPIDAPGSVVIAD